MQLAFGAGALWGNRTDATGSGIGPDQFGILQDVQIDWDWQTKELYGQFQFPVDIARGQGKITGKAKFARIFGAIYGDLFFGQTPATGQLTVSENEAATVPATGPYTVTAANAANFVDDLGVFYAAGGNAGNRFTRVTTPSAAGQYSVNLATGIYTLSAADAAASLAVSYLYNNPSRRQETGADQPADGLHADLQGDLLHHQDDAGRAGRPRAGAQRLHRHQTVAADQDRRLRNPGIRFLRLRRRHRHDRHFERQRVVQRTPRRHGEHGGLRKSFCHPGGGRDPRWQAHARLKVVPAFAGMTV